MSRNLFISRRGSIIVDAACCLPAFIISFCLLLSLINQAGAEESSYAKMAKQVQTQVDLIAVSGADIDVDYLIQFDFPGNGVMTKLLYRPFVGESEDISSEDDELVYIFTKRGIRYHKYGCSTMIDGDRELILTNTVRYSYKACELCKPGSLPNGALVYMYSESSTVYHRKSCASVTKSFETMSRSEAEGKGYSPCMLCIGHDHDN